MMTRTGRFAETKKQCPRCGSSLLVNDYGQHWCSFVECMYGMDDEDDSIWAREEKSSEESVFRIGRGLKGSWNTK